ncbi:MAG TPA: hypothetical protein VJM50_21110 [Pyrinomonadaceae bacterium]|nr:hypothetical protein [Pyrinomonadaceae bacterium]
MKTPRGVRNNNPGNIDYHEVNNWVGQLGIEEGVDSPRFARFDTPENGIRAMTKLLVGYHRKGFKSVEAMIHRWAPSSENDTGAYVDSVARKVGIQAGVPLTLSRYLLVIMTAAIIQHENGYQPYSMDVIREGVSRAFP